MGGTVIVYQWILDEIVKKNRSILGEMLTGIYLHGSMAMGCFHPEKSDMDLIVVVEEDVSDGQKAEFMKEIVRLNGQGPPGGIEISMVKREYCRPFRYPTPFELHFSPMHLTWFRERPQEYIEKMQGEDKDLAAHFTVIQNYGIVLYGEAIEKVFAPVPGEAYMDSILYDIENAKEAILGNPIYVILNLCRALAYAKDGLCLSKKDGAQWGIEHCPDSYHKLIREAAVCYETGKGMEAEPEEAAKFAEGMLAQIAAAG